MTSLDINGTFGALQIGVLVSYMLFGVTTTQAYVYYGRFPQDSRRLKAFVVFVWFCELAQTVCAGHALYVMNIGIHSGNLFAKDRIPKSLAVAGSFGGIAAACVQAFFARRIYNLSQRLPIPCFCWTLSALRTICSFAMLVPGTNHPIFSAFVDRWHLYLEAVWAIGSVNDFTIAATLVCWLYRYRPDMRPSALVDKLIAWTIETGVVTGCSGLVTLVCFLTMRNNYVWIGWYLVTAKLYSNSLLASLNSRETLRAMENATLPLSLVLPDAPIEFEVTKTRTVDGSES